MGKLKKMLAVVMGSVILVGVLAGCATRVKNYQGTMIPDLAACLDLDESYEIDVSNDSEIEEITEMLENQVGDDNVELHFYQNMDTDLYMEYVKVLIKQNFDPLNMHDPENQYYIINSNDGVYLVVINIGSLDDEGLLGVYPFKIIDSKMDDGAYSEFLEGVENYY